MTALLAATAHYVFKYEGWTWDIAWLFGAVLSATDPVAVVAIMKDLGASKRLGLLIEGESMLNDGSAIVLFEILIDKIEGHEKTALEIIKQVIWVAGGGPVVGYLMGQLDVFLLQWAFNDSLAEITITITSAYVVFIVAENVLRVSPVLAVVMLGVTLSNNKTSISPEIEVTLHNFWEALAFLANTSIFAICGTTVTRKVLFTADTQDAIYAILLYIATQVIRALAFIMFAPVLRRLGYGLTWKDGLVCTWSGLRGAVGLALALIIFRSEVPGLTPQSVGNKVSTFLYLTVTTEYTVSHPPECW
ncbi:sodium/hydrogen exchanger 10-like [Plakobranchus ocellatus]|uniref:Sodium/hydrogen exchanger 10-like n=1 Tax=Plakobranchus ocellatus TaxID=259542 RepID=A0AAV4E1Z6_9GAST|nr:sodium/hydrogen exchanger 10-like [Plakobranchus ocellatus]